MEKDDGRSREAREDGEKVHSEATKATEKLAVLPARNARERDERDPDNEPLILRMRPVVWIPFASHRAGYAGPGRTAPSLSCPLPSVLKKLISVAS